MENVAAMLGRYQEARALGRKVSAALLDRLPKSAFQEGARNLGVLRDNTLVLDGEQQMAVVMDYCIHDLRPNGRNAVEQWLATGAASLPAAEIEYLEALRQARFSYWQVEEIERGSGVRVRDLLNGEKRFLIDVGLSTTARVGVIMMGRLIIYNGLTMTTGASLGVGGFTQQQSTDAFEQELRALQAKVVRDAAAESVSNLNRMLIQLCFELTGEQRGPQRVPAAEPSGRGARVGRNDPCPCGSGRKFKHCCGGRR